MMNGAEKIYDVIIIGGGPAGLSAAIYLTRARYSVLVMEKEQFGGQITITHEVVNYPGVGKCSGKELTDMMYRQAEYFGADFVLAEAVGLDLKQEIKVVHSSRGDFQCLGVLLATGAHPRMVGFEGEEQYRGRGVAYCATCDGEFFTGKEVFVIGGGFAAAEESIFLTKFASHVTILIRGEDFSCAEAVANQARNHEKITVLTNCVVEEVRGDSGLTYIRYRNHVTGEVTEHDTEGNETFGVFVFAGYAPETELVKGMALLDKQGYIVTDKGMKTSVEGLYAAGDICIKPLRQVVTATSDGALAATELEKYVSKLQEKSRIPTKDPIIREQVFGSEKEPDRREDEGGEGGQWITPQMRSQLETVFDKMENPLVLKLYVDQRTVSKELTDCVTALVSMTDKLTMEVEQESGESFLPCVRLFRKKKDTGLAFHGVPGGHEFTSFVLGMYNAAGPGQSLDEPTRQEIAAIQKPVEIKILVSLSCTMCPELVVAAQHIAALSDNVKVDVYDIRHFPSLKEQYHVMSVPCMVINEEQVHFGKKNMRQLMEILRED